jgi:hypothetical protein
MLFVAGVIAGLVIGRLASPVAKIEYIILPKGVSNREGNFENN